MMPLVDRARRSSSPGLLTRDKPPRRFRQSTEGARHRDVLRHLLPWCDVHKFDIFSAPPEMRSSPAQEGNAQTCPDTALLAFAQLAALRLNVRRSYVSLLTTRETYVLAEASRTMSLQCQPEDTQADRAWIAPCRFPRDDGLTPTAIERWCSASSLREAPPESGHWYTDGASPHWQIISDLRPTAMSKQAAVNRFADWARFYCGIPLRSARGSVIGALTILDDRPRWGIEASDMSFLEDIADTVTEHLHATIVRAQRQRSERLIQALGLFNSGKGSLREWWLTQEDDRNANAGRHAQTEVTQSARQAIGDAEFGFEAPQAGDAAQESAYYTSDSSNHQRGGRIKSVRQEASSTTKRPKSKSSRTSASTRRPRNKASSTRTSALDIEKASENTYERASNLLREALGVNGVVFVHTHNVLRATRPNQSGSDRGSSGSDGPPAPESSGTDLSDSHAEKSTSCRVIGSSLRHKQADTVGKSASLRFNFPESYLQHLIRRYPRGRIFNFGESGSILSGSSEGETVPIDEGKAKRASDRGFYGPCLRQVMDGANSIAFYPLWDETEERWRSAAFAWSTSPFRVFDEAEDLTYLSAFGHSLVSELCRLETLAADRAKGKFISSISHELRSPLHGILAGVEFLQDSPLSLFQQEMAHTIQKAGQTLLNTINHLLDFSKISNLTHGPRKYRQQTIKSLQNGSVDMHPKRNGTLDLAQLTEQLVETVVSAHRFEHYYLSDDRSAASGDSAANSGRPGFRQSCGDVSLILNIVGRRDWNTRLQPGGFTRIVTNLVGNALKYTPKGSITVTLHADASETDKHHIRFIVEDTGIGITKDFLDNHLYTPFKQEDSHSTGTGLGLSIVKQIATDMGATMAVTSTIGHGTRVEVAFSAKFVSSSSTTAHQDQTGPQALGAPNPELEHVHLLEPEVHNDYDDLPSGFSLVRANLLSSCTQWLGCQTSCGPKLIDTDSAVVYVIAEEYAMALTDTDASTMAELLDEIENRGARLLILACSVRSMSIHGVNDRRLTKAVFVHQPIGPQKLIRAINRSGQELITPSQTSEISAVDTDISSGPLDSTGTLPWSETASIQSRMSRPSTNRFDRAFVQDLAAGDGERALPSGKLNEKLPPSRADCLVMLVEDNEVNMKLLIALMKRSHVQYRTATNGREALDLYRNDPSYYRLILMDLSMPVMDGITATARIRDLERSRHYQRTMIVALTGVTDQESKQRAFASGVDEFRTKPMNMKDLEKLVEAACAQVDDE